MIIWLLVIGIAANAFIVYTVKYNTVEYKKPVFNKNNSAILWEPPNEEILNWQNRAPFHHMPRSTDARNHLRKIRRFIIETVRMNCKCPPTSVLVVYLSIGDVSQNKPIIEESMEACGCKNYQRIGNIDSQGNIVIWDHWMTKIEVILDFVSNFELFQDVKFIIYADAHDTALVGDASNVVNDFKMYQTEFLTGNTYQSVPKVKQEVSEFERDVAPWSQNHPHLNAGGFMATVENMKHYMTVLKDEYGPKVPRHKFDDQVFMKQMHMKYYPKVKVDSLTKIFTRVDEYIHEL